MGMPPPGIPPPNFSMPPPGFPPASSPASTPGGSAGGSGDGQELWVENKSADGKVRQLQWFSKVKQIQFSVSVWQVGDVSSVINNHFVRFIIPTRHM